MSISTTSLLSSLWFPAARGGHTKRFAAAIKSGLALLLLVALSACSGGGGGSSSASPPPAAPFTFAQAGPITLYTGATFTNTANGLGADAVSYKSGNTDIARVDASTGLVTIIGAGTVEIAAYKLVNIPNAASQLIADAATYTITASDAPLSFEQAGPLDLYVRDKITNTVSGPGPGVNAYKSSDVTVATVDSVTGEITAVGLGHAEITGAKVIDVPNDPNHTQVAVSTATYTVNVIESGPEFSARYFHTVVPFNNQLWLIDGRNSDDILSDIWSSTDAITWTKQTPGTVFSGRAGQGAVVFNGRLWVIGGYDGTVDTSDVWSSADGLNWTQETANAFPVRQAFQTVVFNNRLWMIGGAVVDRENFNAITNKNDVWSSADGITWTEETASAGFPARYGHQVVNYNNKLWLIGGLSTDTNGDSTAFNDVWSSVDGVNWSDETASAAFPARQAHQVAVYNNQLWLVAGNNGVNLAFNDVWSSSDGVNWTEQTAAAPFSIRSAHQLVAYDNKLILIGGYSDDATNDVWSSTDGINWLVVYRGAFSAP